MATSLPFTRQVRSDFDTREEQLKPYLAVLTRAQVVAVLDPEKEAFEVLIRLLEITPLKQLESAERIASWHRNRKPELLAERTNRRLR